LKIPEIWEDYLDLDERRAKKRRPNSEPETLKKKAIIKRTKKKFRNSEITKTDNNELVEEYTTLNKAKNELKKEKDRLTKLKREKDRLTKSKLKRTNKKIRNTYSA